ncbi:MAG: GtrA family protein [Clostridia bacterium]|nr:GtrA family protein [Clostridia bacterium]
MSFKIKEFLSNSRKIMKDKNIPFSKKIPLCLGEHYDFVLYFVVGVLTTVVNLIVYFSLVNLTEVDPYTSTAVAWVVSMLFAFFVNKIWVFSDKDWGFKHAGYQFITFAAARILSFGIEELVMFLGIELCHINENVIKIPTQVAVVLINYVASKLFIFKKKDDGSDKK